MPPDFEYHDAIHGIIRLPSVLYEFIREWRPLRRLEKISQIGLAKYVYRNANHSRYDHSIGTIGAVQRIFMAAKDSNANWTNQLNQSEVELMACIHDVGHGPYSHASEMLLKRNPRWRFGGITSHETITELLIGSENAWKKFAQNITPSITTENRSVRTILDNVTNRDDGISYLAKSAIEFLDFEQGYSLVGFAGSLGDSFGKNRYGIPNSAAYSIISNQFDVDRLDYMLRDGHHTELITDDIISTIWKDFVEAILPSKLRYSIPNRGEKPFPGVVFKDTVIDSLELFLWVRQNHFKKIAFHPVTRLAQKLWLHACERKLNEIEKLKNIFSAQEHLLSWFVKSNDDDLKEELGNYPEIRDIEYLSHISYADLLDPQKMRYGDWAPVACPFWFLEPNMRISLLDILDDKGTLEREPYFLRLEMQTLRNLDLYEEYLAGHAYIDFAIPPVYIPDSLIHISQTDHTPWSFATNRSAALSALALAPFKEGQIVLYTKNNVNRMFDRHDLREAVTSAIVQSYDAKGKLFELAVKAAQVLRSSQALTVAELSNNDELSSFYENAPALMGVENDDIKEMRSSGIGSGYCLELAMDLDKLWVCGFLDKSTATFHMDQNTTIWANFLVKYKLNDENKEELEDIEDFDDSKSIQNYIHENRQLFQEAKLNLELLINERQTRDDQINTVYQTINIVENVENSIEKLLSGVIALPRFFSIPLRPERGNCSIPALIHHVIRVYLGFADRNRVNFEVKVDPKCQTKPAFVDRNMLFIAFSNLLHNAIKYSPSGTTIYIEVHHDNQTYRISIDNIPETIFENQHDEIFEYGFFSSRSGGKGIGLFIAKRIVEAHGGTIRYRGQAADYSNIKEVSHEQKSNAMFNRFVVRLPHYLEE